MWVMKKYIYICYFSERVKFVVVEGRVQTLLLLIMEGGLWLCQGKTFLCCMRKLVKDHGIIPLYLGTMQVVRNFGVKRTSALDPSTAGERLCVVSTRGCYCWHCGQCPCHDLFLCLETFLLARILDVKPKAKLFVYKIPGCKTVMLWEFFPYFTKLVFPVFIHLVHPSRGQSCGFISNLLNTDVGLCKEMVVWKQVAHAKCPVSRRRATRFSAFAWCVLRPVSGEPGKILNFDCLGYFQCQLFWPSRKFPLQEGEARLAVMLLWTNSWVQQGSETAVWQTCYFWNTFHWRNWSALINVQLLTRGIIIPVFTELSIQERLKCLFWNCK